MWAATMFKGRVHKMGRRVIHGTQSGEAWAKLCLLTYSDGNLILPAGKWHHDLLSPKKKKCEDKEKTKEAKKIHVTTTQLFIKHP